ncbi:hypothetical protein [Psychrobacter urativorans]|uniref:SH3b domain-containing protein n=1 Tax=Psychrobacter urativorans TaxID=45610 RepID=A0A0M3V973_9GAMM|nr:hypothetical protein [Psychrobacter urativorans]ALF60137.1 hypothetical protein AOC03_08880 [Psychrobacter urativorans]
MTASKPVKPSLRQSYQYGVAIVMLVAAMSAQAAPVSTAAEQAAASVDNGIDTSQTNNEPTLSPEALYNHTLAAQLQPEPTALSAANQKLVSENISLQRQVDDLQNQVNVLVYESKGHLFLYGAFTVLISLLVGIFISWLLFRRRVRW